jgi:hypothetical protein
MEVTASYTGVDAFEVKRRLKAAATQLIDRFKKNPYCKEVNPVWLPDEYCRLGLSWGQLKITAGVGWFTTTVTVDISIYSTFVKLSSDYSGPGASKFNEVKPEIEAELYRIINTPAA